MKKRNDTRKKEKGTDSQTEQNKNIYQKKKRERMVSKITFFLENRT
jgi:hypothetical protein